MSSPYLYGEHEEVRVKVEHTFYLAIPYAARIFHEIADRAPPNDGRELSFGSGEYGVVIRAASSMVNQGVQDYVEVEEFY